MDIFLGYAGLAIAWSVVMFVLMMIFIKANNISWKLKFLLIPLVMWFSVALYHVPSNFMGWPTEKWTVQNEVIILDIHIEEGNAIYFWVIDFNIKNVRNMINPTQTFYPYLDSTPRAYKVRYDSELHKHLIESKRKLQEMGRGGMSMHLERLQGLTLFEGNTPLFKLFDPAEVLKKATDDQ